MKLFPLFSSIRLCKAFVALFALAALMTSNSTAQEIPSADRRASEIRHLDLTYQFTPYKTKDEWTARAQFLREQILFAAGLLPMPEKTPLNAKIFGRTDKGDYLVEKVYFESTPGHYVTGNLYRPKNVTGKAPAVLCPHGHWAYGRLEHQPNNSGQARAANFARQGYVAFTWDMVGYNDSTAISHTFANHKENLVAESLWGVNLLGLQLWNSIRAVDFISSLSDVDTNRIGVTGESGGGTQTFLLYAVDDRIKVSAPVNMISSTMQGGCICENTPLLRIDTNNMEIGACMAPRPMMMIAATGDWTKNTPTVEFPAVQSVYQLFDAADNVKYTQFEAPHNYNQASREAVYGWFAHWLQNRQETTPIKEKSFNIPTLTELLVFYGQQRPANEMNEAQLTAALITARKKQITDALPRDTAGFENYKNQFRSPFAHALMVEAPKPDEIISTVKNPPGITLISRRGKNDLVSLTLTKSTAKKKFDSIVLIASPDSEYLSGTKTLSDELLKAGHTVAFLSCFAGKINNTESDKFKFQTTYNRTLEANRIQDIVTALTYLEKIKGNAKISVVGVKDAGLYTLLARAFAPNIDRVVIDAAQFDNDSDEQFLRHLAIPGIRRAGDFNTATILAPMTPMLIQNTANKFKTDLLLDLYRRNGKEGFLKTAPNKLSDTEIVTFLSTP